MSTSSIVIAVCAAWTSTMSAENGVGAVDGRRASSSALMLRRPMLKRGLRGLKLRKVEVGDSMLLSKLKSLDIVLGEASSPSSVVWCEDIVVSIGVLCMRVVMIGLYSSAKTEIRKWKPRNRNGHCESGHVFVQHTACGFVVVIEIRLYLRSILAA
jgi:hypothetical protein